MSETLAIHGGPKTIREPFPAYNPYGPEEAAAAQEVIGSGVLSKFLGAWHDDFYGGPRVRSFEQSWSEAFAVKHAVTVNSATSGLIAALGAIGVCPGDEIIVSPWTMSATATAILVWNAIPVFADIETDTFGLDPQAIERAITPLTRAIVVTDIFGHGADLPGILALARKHGLVVIEDAAQAPWALYQGRRVGTIADIGVFSLNYHKHIHTGEGGVCVSNNDQWAERMRMIRNHAEAVEGGRKSGDLVNMIGFNFRLGEIEAAMGCEQLKKLPRLADSRRQAGIRLTRHLQLLPGLRPPLEKPDCTHVYYVYPMLLDPEIVDVPKNRIVDALQAEGVPGLMRGYLNLHLLPMYQRKIAFGDRGYPWVGGPYSGKVSYEKGICPAAERCHETTMIGLLTCAHWFDEAETDLVGQAFTKVWSRLEDLT